MRHYTQDPAQRAADIADRVAAQCWAKHHDLSLAIKTWLETCDQALSEFGQSSSRPPSKPPVALGELIHQQLTDQS